MPTIYDGARPDEKFHVDHAPRLVKHIDTFLVRYTTWSFTDGYFTSWWLFNRLQLYYGTMKCDGSRTYWARAVGLISNTEYIITTTPKELLAFRWRVNGPGPPVWDNQGGS